MAKRSDIHVALDRPGENLDTLTLCIIVCYNIPSVVILMFRVNQWLEEEPERRRKLREEKRKRLQQRRNQPKHFFEDQAYMDQLRANEEEMDDALKQGQLPRHADQKYDYCLSCMTGCVNSQSSGLVATSSKGLKRKQPESGAGQSSLKKAKYW